MMLATWVQVARNARMVPLLHLIKHQELRLQIAKLAPKVKKYIFPFRFYFGFTPVKDYSFSPFDHRKFEHGKLLKGKKDN